MGKKYSIGLDLGINNVGWAVFDNETNEIKDYGVRRFNQSDSAADRRTQRSTRRRMKREETRVNDILKELSRVGFPDKKTIDSNLIEKRYKAVNQKVEKQDITNILCFLVSNRGYIPFGDEEVNFVDLNGLLPCEYYYNLYCETGKYRDLQKVVKHTDNIKEISRMFEVQSEFYPELKNDLPERIINIFERKRKFWEGPGSFKSNQITPFGRFKTKEDINEYNYNKSINPNYEKYIFEDLIGKCKININEKCAPKLNYYAEYFNFLNDFINISFENIEKIEKKEFINTDIRTNKLNKEGLMIIKDYIFKNKKINIDKMFQELLGTTSDNVIGLKKNKQGKNDMSMFNYYKYIKNLFENDNMSNAWLIDIEQYNRIISYLTIAPGIVEIKNMVNTDPNIKYKFTEEEFKLLGEVIKNKNKEMTYHALSETALKRAINDMLKYEMNFMQVRKKLNYDKEAQEFFKKNYTKKNGVMPLIEDKYVDDIIASPQVKKTLRQAIKVLNAIILKEKALPETIAIESTKELNGKEMKASIEKEQRLQDKLRKDAEIIIESKFGESYISEGNIEKVMLYNEINGHCAYCNKPIDLNEVIHGKIEVEHILPRSKSFDNSFNNKTLACKECNSKKSNKTPYSFLHPQGLYEEFEKRIKSLKMSDRKFENLLLKGDLDKYSIRFINRNLRDTAYATTELINQIKIFNIYLEEILNNTKIKTLSTPGQLTHRIRGNHKIIKNRDDGVFHHAVDAAIVASITNTDIGKLIIESQNNDKFWIFNGKKIGEKVNMLNNVSLEHSIDSIKKISEDNTPVSFQTIKNPQGKLANSNIYKIIEKEGKTYKIDQIDNIYDIDFSNKSEKERFEKLLQNKDMTLLCYDNNKDLFNYIKDIYEKYKDDKGNPFVNYVREVNELSSDIKIDGYLYGIRVPSRKNNGPFIKRLRYYSTINDPYLLKKDSIKTKNNTKIAFDSLSQSCTRVYIDIDNKRFVFLPIFAISMDLDNRVINENDYYYKMNYQKYIGDNNVKHIVDLYNGEYIEVIKKNGQIIEGIYQCFHKPSNSVCLKNGSYFTRSDREFTLYSFDILGKKYKRLTYKAF